MLLRREAAYVWRWAGQRTPDEQDYLPRKSFAAWEEIQRHTPNWQASDCKALQMAATQIYMNISQQFVTRLITRQTAYDLLTNLPNWIIFNQQLTPGLLDALHAGEILTVMVLASDRFKRINESFGHAGGDYLLEAIARRLETLL